MVATSPTAAAGTCELHAGALRLALRADLGGSIAGFWHGDTPVLKSTEPALLADARDSASYPLVPYSNRIGLCRFRFKGRDYTTERNFNDGPHSLHVVGWMRPWQVVSNSAVEVVLNMQHAPDAHWPFAFEARQFFALTPQSLTLQMQITNPGDVAQPVGLGWHPYFPRRARSRLHAELSDRWDYEPTLLPTRKVAQPGIDADVAHLDFDNCFEGWRGPVRIRDERLSLQLTSSLSYLVIYARPQRDVFCVEPVSHVNNAIHMADPASHGLRTLEPGETFDAWMKLEVALP